MAGCLLRLHHHSCPHRPEIHWRRDPQVSGRGLGGDGWDWIAHESEYNRMCALQ